MKKKRILYSILGMSFLLSLSSCKITNLLSSNTFTNKSTSQDIYSEEDDTTEESSKTTSTSTSTTTKTTSTTDSTSITQIVDDSTVTTSKTTDDSSYEISNLKVSNIATSSILKNTTLETYYYDSSEIPYVSFKNYFNILQGIISASSIKETYDESLNTYTYTKTTADNEEVKIIVSPDTNEITLTNYPFYIDALGNSNMYSVSSSKIKTTKEYIVSPKDVTINLSDYGMEILQINGEALVPEAIVNVIVGSPLYYNVYYTGSSYTLDSSTASTTEKQSFSKVTLTESDELRLYTYNTLAFIIDQYYGLNEYNGYDGAYDLLSDYKDDLLSTTSKTNIEATLNVLYGVLDEGHTGVASLSYFYNSNTNYSYQKGERLNALNNSYQEVYSYYKSSSQSSVTRPTFPGFYNSSSTSSSTYQTSGDTAMIILDGFESADDSTDTYTTVKNALDISSSYKNFVINLSLNGGGSIASMVETLGLITNDDIVLYVYNEHTGAIIKYTYQVDCDLDGDFTDDDAYTNYNYYVITSGYSYSAANTFANIAKEGDFATIIGEHSGGGANIVLPTCLPDGTSFQTSGQISMINYESSSNTYEIIDSGIDVDYSLSTKYFFKISYIDSFINTL